MLNKNISRGGFIALVSAIIIAVVLLTLVVATSFSGFFGRFDIVDSEIKEVSQGLAEACVETAIIKHSQDDTYAGGDTIVVDDKICKIVSVLNSGSTVKIQTQGEYKEAYTNLEVVVSLFNYEVISWEEKPQFP